MTVIDYLKVLGVSSLEFQSVWLARLAGPSFGAARRPGRQMGALPIEVGSGAARVARSGFFSSGTWYEVAAAESTEGVRVAV